MRLAAYVYPGWHPTPERDEAFRPGFTEWDLVAGCRPRFEGHAQPRVPLLGPYDDRDPLEVGRRVRLATAHGIDAFVHGFFWCRGKRVFQDALDLGFLGSPEGSRVPFALMWANRMPRRVLPVARADLPVIEDDRRVPSDVDDFVAFVGYLAERYFRRPNYLRIGERPYLSIFDSTFFLRELGLSAAAEAIRRARAWLASHGFPDLHLAAVEPSREVIGRVREVGFDSVTHYVFLPDWKGPFLQDYDAYAKRRAGEWASFRDASGLPYMPSVSPGWDASPRGADFGPARPDKYPWSPVVTGERPDLFRDALARALAYAKETRPDDPLAFVASLNEWSEGHYLEPDTRFGNGWLDAVRDARAGVE
ncbi:MAG TPA: glycoside hydrolase family 99-like domain-containing protein [Planctomycetota bacterium]|nr:glycoside hydrolase family 99-like domain-containing protein [Planctomycetota bacterium]